MTDLDGWAPYYDVIHDGLPGEAEFYVNYAKIIGGTALELGCGTGRIALPMAMAGVDVIGLDKSQAMLQRCKDKMAAIGNVKGDLQLVIGDMENFDLKARFDFIFMAYRTFMHLLTSEAQRSCLTKVREHLNDGGVFIFNTWLPKIRQILYFSTGHKQDDFNKIGEYAMPSGTTLIHHHTASCDEFGQLLIEKHRLQERDLKGNVINKATLPLVRAWATYREIDNLVRACGFEVLACHGDFNNGPLTCDSSEMVWLLRKK